MGLRHGSLFSGIGGFDLAAEWMGWENVFHCEWNEFGTKVLKHYWPKAISYHDITKTDFTIHRGTIDILTGGFPCQPYSQAGKRLGKEDDRHLWPQMCRAIREIQPRWVVGENVFGLINWNGGMVFDEVQADLEAEGYEVFPYVLPAAGVGSCPHRRDRIWFIAYSNGPKQTDDGGADDKEEGTVRRNEEGDVFGELPGDGITSGPDDPGNTSSEFRTNRNWTEEIVNGGQPQFKFSRHIQSRWQNFPTQSPVCSGDDGLSERLGGITFPKWRNESIKAYGNAVVPQVVYQIFKAIEEYEKTNQWK